MKTIKEFFIDNQCYFRIEKDIKRGLRAVIKAGYMHLTNWYDTNEDIEAILNHAVTELKLRAKVSKDLTLCKINNLLKKLENRNQTTLDL